MTCVSALQLMPCVAALQLLSSVHPRTMDHLRRCGTLTLSADDFVEKETDEEGSALAAAFAKRLEEEGGATRFKIKSSLNEAKEGLTEATFSAKAVASDAASSVSDAGNSIVSASPVALIGGLFATVLIFTVVSAGFNSAPVDTYTSDGQALSFGKRSQTSDGIPLSAYQPEYGSQ
eukprot:CAMPEP_0174704576 /NCGR_PEP_ID=MMETSP1094-20130205/8117_1 /TAXON_ID=156173 /ORGANISM="Chrysochromulina brevifilum, Strain UTEX LB 985" /LENGTH=175 /DNA_ID=CAMNT_0015902645 /DNA_START=26 /DNA_END=553 /DNA_ORIENTATION=-